jgi:hypothetical protein
MTAPTGLTCEGTAPDEPDARGLAPHPSWVVSLATMLVRIRGLLKLRSAAAAEEALAAFDGEAYPEFFTSDIWTTAATFLSCDAAFELEADCDPKRAVRAIVACSVEGVVETHGSGDAEGWQFSRSKGSKAVRGESVAAARFGEATAALGADWKDALEKARAGSAKKAKTAASKSKKSPSIVVELGGSAVDLVALADGHFAALVHNEVIAFGVDGKVVARHSIALPGDDGYSFRPVGLTELLDGQLAIAGDYTDTMRVLDRATGAVRSLSFPKTTHAKSVLPVPGGFVRYQDLSLVLGDEVRALPVGTTAGASDFPSKAMRWSDRFVIEVGGKNLVYGPDGSLLFETEGGKAVVFRDRLYTSYGSNVGRTEPDGRFTETQMRSRALLVVGEALLAADGSAVRYDGDEKPIWSAPGIYDRANSGTPIALTDDVIVMTPAPYPPSARLVVVDFTTGKALGEVSGKGELESTFRVDADTVIGLAHGAQGKTLHVFRDLRTAPKYEGLGGHTKPITRVAISGRFVATRSEDGTSRIFDLAVY